MSSFLSCPRCNRHVSLPVDAPPSSLVRCPLCAAEYSLQDALDHMPPMLVLIAETRHVEPLAGTSLSANDSTEDVAFDGPEIDTELEEAKLDDLEVRGLADFDAMAHGEHSAEHPARGLAEDDQMFAEGGLRALDDPHEAELDLPLGRATSGEPESSSDLNETMDIEWGSAPEEDFESGESPSAVDDEEIGLEPAAADTFQLEGQPALVGADGPSAAAPVAVKASPRAKRQKPPLFMSLINYVGGGLLGCWIGYLALLWIKGPSVDFLSVGSQLPAWMVPADFQKPKAIASAPTKQPAPPIVPAAQDDTEFPPLPSKVPPFAGRLPQGESSADDSVGDMSTDASIDEAFGKDPESASPDTSDDVAKDDVAKDDAGADTADMEVDDEAKPPKKPVLASPGDDDFAADPALATDSTGDPVSDAMADESTDDVSSADAPADDVAADDAAEPVAEAAGPRDAMRYTTDDVDHAVADVRTLGESMAGASKDDLKKIKNQYYRKLYQLGEVLTFAEKDPADPRSSSEAETVGQILDQAAADEAKFVEIGKAAAKWLNVAKGKEHQGIVLTGIVEGITKKGRVFETRIALAGGTQVVSVLSLKSPQAAPQDKALVLGSIVEDPATNIVGYEGVEPTIIWSGVLVKAPGDSG